MQQEKLPEGNQYINAATCRDLQGCQQFGSDFPPYTEGVGQFQETESIPSLTTNVSCGNRQRGLNMRTQCFAPFQPGPGFHNQRFDHNQGYPTHNCDGFDGMVRSMKRHEHRRRVHDWNMTEKTQQNMRKPCHQPLNSCGLATHIGSGHLPPPGFPPTTPWFEHMKAIHDKHPYMSPNQPHIGFDQLPSSGFPATTPWFEHIKATNETHPHACTPPNQPDTGFNHLPSSSFPPSTPWFEHMRATNKTYPKMSPNQPHIGFSHLPPPRTPWFQHTGLNATHAAHPHMSPNQQHSGFDYQPPPEATHATQPHISLNQQRMMPLLERPCMPPSWFGKRRHSAMKAMLKKFKAFKIAASQDTTQEQDSRSSDEDPMESPSASDSNDSDVESTSRENGSTTDITEQEKAPLFIRNWFAMPLQAKSQLRMLHASTRNNQQAMKALLPPFALHWFALPEKQKQHWRKVFSVQPRRKGQWKKMFEHCGNRKQQAKFYDYTSAMSNANQNPGDFSIRAPDTELDDDIQSPTK